MSRRILAIDALVAATLAAVVLIVSPGVALAAVIALVVLILCAVSLAVEGVAGRWRRRRRRGA